VVHLHPGAGISFFSFSTNFFEYVLLQSPGDAARAGETTPEKLKPGSYPLADEAKGGREK